MIVSLLVVAAADPDGDQPDNSVADSFYRTEKLTRLGFLFWTG